MFSVESPHRGNPNVYTQYTIFNIKKKEITLNYSKSAAMEYFPRNLRSNSKQLCCGKRALNVRAIEVLLYFITVFDKLINFVESLATYVVASH